MEPPLKRVRRFGPVELSSHVADDSDYTEQHEGRDAGQDAGDSVQEGELEIDSQGDPDMQLEQVRAQLDNKLKSKFEAIFEKYGKDFTGIGDEIDLATGEIVVNNGHLQEMEDEMDDGTSKPSILRSFVVEQEEGLGSTEAEDSDVDEVDDSRITLQDMEEDDMILFQDGSAPIEPPKTPLRHSPSVQVNTSPKLDGDQGLSEAKSAFPSEPEILAQFGQELGPKIAKYVSQQKVLDDSNIEPAWRTPGLPFATPGKRPILKSILLHPDGDRSPSPEGSASVWAPKRPRGRPRRDGAHAGAIFRGETIVHDRTWYSSGYMSTTVTKQRTERIDQKLSRKVPSVALNQASSSGEYDVEFNKHRISHSTSPQKNYAMDSISEDEEDTSDYEQAKSQKPRRFSSKPDVVKKPRKSRASESKQSTASTAQKKRRGPRVPFTKADDDAVVEWIIEAQRLGYTIWSNNHWKLFEEKNPRHTYISWADRYRRCHYPKGISEALKNKPIVRRRRRKPVNAPEVSSVAPVDFHSEEDSHPEPEDYCSDDSIMEISHNSSSANDKPIPLRPSPRKDYSQNLRMEDIGPIDHIDPTVLSNGNLIEGVELDENIDPALLSHQNSRVDDINSDDNIDPALRSNQNSWMEGIDWDQNIDPLLRSDQNLLTEEIDPDENIDPLLRNGYVDDNTLFRGTSSGGFLSGNILTSEKPSASSEGLITTDNKIDNTATQNSTDVCMDNGSPLGATVEQISDQKWETAGDKNLPPVGNLSHVSSNPPHETARVFPNSIPNSSASVNQIEWNYDVQQLDSPPTKPDHAPIPKRLPRNILDASYDFSDEDEDIDSEQPQVLLRDETPIEARQNNPVVPQGSSATEVAVETDKAAKPYRALDGTAQGHHQSSPAHAISSHLSEPTAPAFMDSIAERNSNSATDLDLHQPTVSNPTGPENVSKPQSSSQEDLSSPSSQNQHDAKVLTESERGSKEDRGKVSVPGVSSNTATPKNGRRAVIPRKRVGGSPSSSGSQTPSGSKRRCGEKGFRCERDFCFKCMAD